MEPTSLATCSLCRHLLETAEERTRGICNDCRASTGLVSPVPALRPPAPCRRCNHTQLVRAVLRDRTVTLSGGERLAPTAVTFGLKKETSLFLQNTTVTPDASETFGLVVAHICRGCGYTELYTAGFAELPIGPEYGTELLDAAPPGPPFR